MTDQIDIAEDLGVTRAELPEWYYVESIPESPHRAPPQLIGGILHQGCKMILSGTSKSNKSWCLLDLAMSVASGQEWWGRPCTKGRVIYLNFELQPWAINERLGHLFMARPECKFGRETLAIWNLRGHNTDLSLLRPKLEERLAGLVAARQGFGLIIVDPVYKVLGDRDENANGEIAGLMNEFEGLAQKTGAAVVMAHHFAKGDSSSKSAIDRMSGAGAWARDPDSLVVLTPHEEERCFTVSTVLRNLPMLDEFVVRWDFPLMRMAAELNPEALKRPQGRGKCCTEKEFTDAAVTDNPKGFSSVIKDAMEILNMSRRTAVNYLNRQVEAGLVRSAGGLYWRAK